VDLHRCDACGKDCADGEYLQVSIGIKHSNPRPLNRLGGRAWELCLARCVDLLLPWFAGTARAEQAESDKAHAVVMAVVEATKKKGKVRP
jgi:hypothetical protein